MTRKRVSATKSERRPPASKDRSAAPTPDVLAFYRKRLMALLQDQKGATRSQAEAHAHRRFHFERAAFHHEAAAHHHGQAARFLSAGSLALAGLHAESARQHGRQAEEHGQRAEVPSLRRSAMAVEHSA